MIASPDVCLNGGHDNDLMTPPDVLLESALKQAEKHVTQNNKVKTCTHTHTHSIYMYSHTPIAGCSCHRMDQVYSSGSDCPWRLSLGLR